MSDENPQIDEAAIIENLKQVVVAAQAQDDQQIASALGGLCQTCAENGLGPENTLALLEGNGIQGGEPLAQFIQAQYQAIDSGGPGAA